MATHTKTTTRRTKAPASHRRAHPDHGRTRAGVPGPGIYASRYSDDEISRILESAYGGELSLVDEIGLARVALDRCLAAMNQTSIAESSTDDLKPAAKSDLRQLCKLMLDGTGRVANLLRQQRILTGENADSLADNLASTLETIRESLTTETSS